MSFQEPAILCANNQPDHTQKASGYPHQNASIHKPIWKKQRFEAAAGKEELFQKPMPATTAHRLNAITV
jgi:hypothetical protein